MGWEWDYVGELSWDGLLVVVAGGSCVDFLALLFN